MGGCWIFIQLDFKTSKKSCNDSSVTKVLNICKTKSIRVRKISNRWLITFCHRINIITNHVSIFFFFGNDIQKVKAKFLAEIYFRELFCKDSCAKRKTCI